MWCLVRVAEALRVVPDFSDLTAGDRVDIDPKRRASAWWGAEGPMADDRDGPMTGTVRYGAGGNRCSRHRIPGGVDAWRGYLPGKDGGMGIGTSDGLRPSPFR
ncbi:hypothetical protein GCM10010405_50480 [Streptomyces macrosporus]|uniref:Uncharacterized protein n=1 Tax=Streptomyces macrosporus TaxID=44032 RepID=A0ABN3KHD5_9ACTN